MQEKTLTVSVAGPGDTQGCVPEFGRWRDVQRLFGIRRSSLYTLTAEGKIRSVTIRRKGNVRGSRLWYLPSISTYLHSLMADPQNGGSDE